MASVIEQRQIIVQQNIPKLIKALTGFNQRDENFKTCLQFCFSHFKHHRYLSVNSHEIKRDVDGICEKLRFSNFHETEQKFKKLVEECVTHELTVNHYEKDVIYAILNLLTTLAYDPIGNLKTKLREGEEVIKFKPASVKKAKKASDVFMNSLLNENFKLLKNDTDSELSEWTSSDDEDSVSEGTVDEVSVSPTKSVIECNNLRPPERPQPFEKIIIENPEKFLTENIQHSWWTDQISVEIIKSDHLTANFCNLWQKHLSNKSLGFIKPRPLSLISEYCLLREILWMFLNPVECKFFKLSSNEFILRPNVTMPSTMPESLNVFLSDFLHSINLMNRLKTECQKSYKSPTLSRTLETYFKIIQEILDRITEFILEEESVVKSQNTIYTIVTLHNKLRPHAKMLEILWKIHKTSVLDETKFPPHICAAYLIASLNSHVDESCKKEVKNLAIVILMTCLRTYLEIFDVWWTEARLDDLKEEFLMQKSDSETIQPRMLVKNKETSFYLNDEISKKITSDKVIGTMMKYSIKASFTLDIISKLDRINEMRQIVNNLGSLHDEFLSKVNREILKFTQNGKSETEKNKKESHKKSEEISSSKNKKFVEDLKNEILANNDDLLLLVFKSTFDKLNSSPPAPQESQLTLYDTLNSTSDFILLPLEHSIHQALNQLLQKKISIAENFVMNIYSNEFHVEQHLQDMRRIFFVESAELINFFCFKLFPSIETGESTWANPYLLTVALNDALSSARNHSLAMFNVAVKKKISYHSVLDALNEITVNFNVNQNLAIIFPAKLMEKYNDVFRFLLKIKYAQQILNCLRFPDFFKHRTPYAKLQLMDLVIKRLSLTRFAMLHSINSLHNHLMVMLKGLSLQLDAKVAKCQNVSQLISCHEAFVETFHANSFLRPESANVHGIIMETLKLAKVLKEEWATITSYATLDAAGNFESVSLKDLDNNAMEIERNFGVCEYQLKVLLDL